MKTILIVIAILTLSCGLAQTELKQENTSRYYTKISVGFLPGNNLSSSFQIVNGLNITSHLSFGIGLGVERYSFNNYIPIFGHAKYYLTDKPSSPFLAVICGYNFPLDKTDFSRGGITTGLQVGLERSVAKNIALSTSIGYRYAYLKTRNAWWDDFYTIREINRLELKFGIIFK